eukprot:TRINITY_DN24729_c0_g1_i1.p1 TRINITY_DN24729_c0_g1~~TRINITY_DN24729_c0_g1_i1.p1  ORF type:complete len:300 (+),score=111.94 TRINITY_DN24729_c0_g1_i1:159-1058(+)
MGSVVELAGGVSVAVLLASKTGQAVLRQLVPDGARDVLDSFRFSMGFTPLMAVHWPLLLCAGYMLSVYALKAFMRSRAPFDLFGLRVLHNVVLCVGSLAMALGVLTELSALVQVGGAEVLVCDEQRLQQRQQPGVYLWYYVFYLSKFYEFIDTYILILRKKPTIFLHLFHHFSTALLVWHGLQSGLAVQWIPNVLNMSVHVLMYYYYLAQTLGRDVWWKKHLTSIQIVQFFVDLTLMASWLYFKYQLGRDCSGDIYIIISSYTLLGSFIALFLNFYVRQYTAAGARVKADASKVIKKSE